MNLISSRPVAEFPLKSAIKKVLFKASLTLFGALLFQLPAQASDAPDIKPALKKMLGGLSLDVKDQLQKMVGDLKKTSCGGGLSGCYQTKSGPVHLYFFTSNSAQQTFIIVVDKKISMPKLFGNKVQNVMGQTSLRSLMISISTAEFDLTSDRMPPDLKKVVNDSYFGVSSLNFASGAQMAARADLGGPIKLTMESLGVRADQLTMRAAIVMPIPMDISSGAGAGIDVASDLADGATMKKAGTNAAKPEAFVEFQFAPGSRLPMMLPPVTLTDATFFINNNLTFGYKGNAQFQGVGDKKILLQFQTPLTPEGAMDFLDFSFLMATPASFTMEDAARVIVAMASPDPRLAKYGGGFIRGVGSFKGPLLAMAKPLSMFKLKNPNPPPEYRFGDATKPWPEDVKYFNIAVLGPLAQGGPYYAQSGQVAAFGQTLGWTDVSAGTNGYYNGVGADMVLKLGPLGKVPFRLSQETRIDMKRQDITYKGNLAGQKIAITLGTSKMSIEVNASCINPFEIKTSVDITPTTDMAQIFDGQGGVNVDPGAITGCIGKELEAAYRKIAGEYKNLSGYTADMANKELKKISDAALVATKAAEDAANKAAAESKKAAEDAAKASQKAAEDAAKAAQKAADDARKQYEQTKNAARDVANKATNAAANAFKDAGNAFKRIGKKKKHKKGPDPIFAASVFDWDYYYDTATDVVNAKVDLSTHWKDNGFNEGRQGSPEFSAVFYRNRYLDVQRLCGQGDWRCVVQHWLDTGIQQGRQGSAGVSIESYLKRYPDLQNAFGKRNFDDAMDHWLNSGEDEGRDPRPASQVTVPLAGVQTAGGDGGNAWNDQDICDDMPLTGWRLSYNKTVDRAQFLYANGRWSGVQGGKDAFKADVALPSGEYVVRIDYRSGGIIDNIAFITNRGRTFGPYGGNGGSPGSYSATSGEKVSCLSGRAGGSINQLNFTSTGPR
ncbi:jacalin-like lectin [Herminiimonas arsenitoxidans]|uniref:jacalin-like lectin n=1 Tax=Herminiimonas arsenitoxidans TaxID=1809410 RepID=UPI001E38022C|nr:lectin [Herminiimonas arsenitoxidans]